MKASRFWAAARNAALKVVAFWVLIFAAYLALGRQFFPYIDQIKPEIEIWLTTQLGTSVEIGQLQGEWVRFNPVIHLQDVSLGGELSIEKMTLAPGIYESISRKGLSFIRFELVDFSASLVESNSGWQIDGLVNNSASTQGVDLDFVVDLLKRQGDVRFTNSHFLITPLNLPPFELTLDHGQLSGFAGENNLLAQATLRARNYEIPIELQVETSEENPVLNRAYLKHGSIDLSPWLTNVKPEFRSFSVAGEYWVSLEQNKWKNLTARLHADEATLVNDGRELSLSDANFEGHLENKANGFEGWFNLLEYKLNNHKFGSTQAKLSHRADRVKLQWDSLPAEIVGHWFALNDPGAFWSSIEPAGFVEQGIATLDLNEDDSLRVSADLNDLSIKPYKGVPSLSNLSGDIRIEGPSGRMTFMSDQSSFHLPTLYQSPYQAEVVSASMYWQILPEQGLFAEGWGDVVLFGDSKHLESTDALPAKIHWTSVAPSKPHLVAAGRQRYVELNIDFPQLNTSWAKQLSDSELIDPAIAALVDYRLQEARFENVNFNYLSSTDANAKKYDQLFFNATIKDATVGFLDNWSAIEQLNGEFALTLEKLNIVATSAYYPGFNVDDAGMTLDFSSGVMAITLAAQSTAEDAFNFFKTGPLRPLYGARMDGWYGDGSLNTRMSVRVPLANPDAMTVSAKATLHDNSIEMHDIDMSFDQVNGSILYTTERGVFSQDLALKHLGEDQLVKISSSLNQAEPEFQIQVSGETPIHYWGERFDDVYLSSLTESIQHDTDINLGMGEVRIKSSTSLLPIEIDFPFPFSKSIGESWHTELNVHMDDRGWTTVKATVDERLDSYFELNERNEIQRGAVAVNRPLNVRELNGVYFDIYAEQADGDDWWQAIQTLRALYSVEADENISAPSFEELIAQVSIQGGSVDYLSQPWTGAEVNLLRNDEAWLVEFDTNEGQGQVLVPHDDEPIFAEVEWVSLTTGEEEIPFEEQVDSLAGYSPSDIPNMQIQINKLIWNDIDMGDWRTEIITSEHRLIASKTQGRLSGAKVLGDLIWTVEEGKHRSGFQGNIEVGNVFDVLTAMKYAPVLTSRKGNIDMDVSWQGSPVFFGFKRLQGEIDIDLENGAILDVEEYEGVKLIGLLNFTRVLQRIALDFSDLLQQGLTYDKIQGELLFDRGFARVGEKLVIDGSATKFRFNGDADLLSNQLDIDMVLTVPLSSTFPLVALLAGLSPQAAAAIYVTERVFNNELESISSARMHITGSFDEPITKFYRVFDNSIDGQNPTVKERLGDVVPEGMVPNE